MNLEREIEQIKQRLDRIEAIVSGPFTANASPSTGANFYELISFEVRKSQGNIGPEYAYKLAVRNNGSTSAQFAGQVIFLDNNEFEVTSYPIAPFTVAAGTAFTKTGVAKILDKSHVPRIANVTAEVFPL